MSWFDNQDKIINAETAKAEKTKNIKSVFAKLPGGTEFLKVNLNCVKRVYEDDIGGPIMIIIDEAAELLVPNGVKSEEGKEEDAIKNEIQTIIQSVTQLGRSAGIHCVICTQRNGTNIINGTIQNNCIDVDTKPLTI